MPYDPSKIRVDEGGLGGSSGEGSAGTAGAGQAGSGGSAGAAMCTDGLESCNRVDDDCDGETDEGARSSCEQIVLNADTDCIDFQNMARCVMLRCHAGYSNCDGDPTNGCERTPCTCRTATMPAVKTQAPKTRVINFGARTQRV